MSGILFTLDGTEHSGKTTQIGLIQDYLRTRKVKPFITREPGSSSIGSAVRELLLDPEGKYKVNAKAQLHLFFAERAQLYEKLREEYAKGRLILKDRGGASTIAYQGFGAFHGDEEVVRKILEWQDDCIEGLVDDRLWILRVGAKERKRRGHMRGSKRDSFERRRDIYHHRVYQGFGVIHDQELLPNTRLLETDKLLPEQVFEQYLRPDIDSFLER